MGAAESALGKDLVGEGGERAVAEVEILDGSPEFDLTIWVNHLDQV